jgi:DNA-binding MarR family transcriptional regulator
MQLSGDSICCGVTAAQCHTLLAIEEKKLTTVTDLALDLELDKSTLSRTIESLVAVGLVNRETNSGNRRSQHISLTKEGENAVAGIHTQWNDYFESILSQIPAAKRILVMEGLSLLAGVLPSHPACCTGDNIPESGVTRKRSSDEE